MAALTDEGIRLQVLLERVKAGENDKIDAFLREVDKELRERLNRADLSPGQRGRVEALLVQIRAALSALQDRFSADFRTRLDALAPVMADTEAKSMAAALGGFDVSVPTASVIRAAVATAPLSVRGPGGGMLLDAFISKWGDANIDRIEGVIRRGYFEGRTTDQVVRDLRGTKAANYADGELSVSRRNARAVVHTAVQHTATMARVETLKDNEDVIKGYRWVSTLDNHTGQICRSLDGQVFEIGKGPLPPAHPNCRSTIVPVTKSWKELGINIDIEPPVGTRASMRGPVPANLTYYEWLKTQSAEFQDTAIGPERAKLFRDGGLSADEFGRLQLGKNFQPLTLDEMRELAPLVFKRAGLDP